MTILEQEETTMQEQEHSEYETAPAEETSSGRSATPQAMSDHTLVGIDLGTCRTVVVGADGQELEIRSVVGYPKDIISRQAVGDGPLFGNEALEKRNFLDLCHPLAEGVIRDASERDYQAARELIHHLVDKIKENSNGERVSGIIGVPARASLMNKEVLLKVAREVMDTALVVSEPFMVAYALGKLNRCIIVDIGAGTVDVCGMKGSVPAPEDQVTTFKGGDYLDERLEAAILRRHPGAQITRSLACRIKEEHAFVGEPERPVEVTLRVEGKPARFDITEEIRTVCESMVPNIVEQVETLIASFDPEDQEETLKNIYLAGCGSRIRGLDRMLANALHDYGDVRITCVDDPERIGAKGALKLALEVPPAHWPEIGLMFG
ncbi:MamK family actin-like protein [Desulfurivibrio alkaliphilus]|uniref:Actin/actin family protein n=1 Tax=Desulfurivibrio alkaliphilus (strain DSM 19089 / UNIQEM U267 / AHT2) TaxID=589865 RepID=D6Z0X3_DESAT|nr:MamK family actin-like protein [Desulfurivibrio alkaliphilus]ADH87233.1 actin/actin family protein [Desulfurivibrio alkaliphilus AHT 2]